MNYSGNFLLETPYPKVPKQGCESWGWGWGWENASVSKHLLVTPPRLGAPRDTNPFLPQRQLHRQLQCVSIPGRGGCPFPAFLEHPQT